MAKGEELGDVKKSRIFSEFSTFNRRKSKQLSQQYMGINKWNHVSYKTKNIITQLFGDHNIGTGKHKCRALKYDNESKYTKQR